MTFNMATANMNSTNECNGYFSGPIVFEKSFCAMRACSENLYAMDICCKGATVTPYIFPADPHSNLTKGDVAGGFYCLVGDMTWSTWENCTIAQGVLGGICATEVERLLGGLSNGAAREGPGSLLGLVGLVMVLKAMVW